MSDFTTDYSRELPENNTNSCPSYCGDFKPNKSKFELKDSLEDLKYLPPVVIDGITAAIDAVSHVASEATKAVSSAVVTHGPAPVEDTDFISGCWNVVSDLAEGAYEEIVEDPFETALKVVVGVGAGVAAAFLAPVVLVGAAVGAAVGAGYEAYEHGSEWCDSIDKVANPEDYSVAEVDEAHKAVKGMGAVVADVALGAVTGVAGSAIAGVVSSAVRGAAGAEVSSVVSGATKGTAEADVVAAIRPFPKEPPSGGKYVEIEVPIKGRFETNLPLTEAEIAETSGVQASFIPEETGFQTANKEAWAAEIKSLSVTDGEVRSVQLANNWAVAIEERMAAGEPLTKDLADRAFAWINVDGREDWLIASALKEAWIYGKQLNDFYE